MFNFCIEVSNFKNKKHEVYLNGDLVNCFETLSPSYYSI